MNRKVGIIGSVCEKLDGQTIKTKILYDELRKETSWDFYVVNTQDKNKSRFKLLISSIIAIVRCRDIFILVSQNGAKVFFPMLYIATKIFKSRVYHDVIGGSPEDYVINNIKNRKYLNSFIVNWVETEQMVKGLESVGVCNAEVLPNFKNLRVVERPYTDFGSNGVFKFCTFSRVMKEKGIEDAILAIEKYNNNHKSTYLTLDIYGNIDDAYRGIFDEVMKKTSSAISYKGSVPYDQSVDVVKNYYALLFPTYWFGEGFPGTIVDAFSSGVPVIATDWSANSEIVSDGYTGIVYPNKKITSLDEAIEWSVNNVQEMINMRFNCIKEAYKYQPKSHIRRIINRVEER